MKARSWWCLLLLAVPSLLALTEPEPLPADLPDGDQDMAAAQAAYAAAPDEPSALRALATIVNFHRRRGDYAEGLAGASDGLTRAQQIQDLAMQVEFLYLQGRIYWNLTDYPRSLEIHLTELGLAQQLGDPFVLARTHGGLGLTYQRYERDEDALHHFHLGLAEAARAPDNRMRGSLLNSLGNYHLTRGEHARAAELYEEALRIRIASGNARAIAETLTNLGLVADAGGEYAAALGYLQQALATFEALKYRRYIANTHRRLGRVLRNAGRLEDSLASLAAAERYAATLQSEDVQADILQEYALTHEARGNLPAALAAQRSHAALREQLRSAEDRRRMAELRARYGAEQKELEIELLRRDKALQTAEHDRRRSRQIALVSALGGGITLLAALSFFQLLRLRGERRLRLATEDARRRAEAAEQIKTQLLRMASHDLKVPLQALHATAGLIGEQAEDTAGVRRRAGDMQSDTARMQTLVRDFLEISAVEQGHLHVHPARVDLAAIACETAQMLRPLALRRRQQLAAHPPTATLPPVRADERRLRQIFENLLGNALKYTPEGGDINLQFGTQGSWVFAEVRDNGPGLDAKDFARIFDPSPPTPATDGSNGLGLMIVRELLNLQGGRLEVQSQPGRGAVFRVLFPGA
jgi:signal transduction histidine kinase